MTAALIPTPVMQFLDADGNPLVGGKVYTYAAGTSTPLATFTDYGGATPNANPVILNSRGEASIWFGTAAYKLELYTAANVLIWTADNVSASTPVVYGTGVAAALAINVGTAGSILVNGGVLGTPSSGLVTNLTGTASININGTVGATTANTGAFTTLSASGTATMAAINASGVITTTVTSNSEVDIAIFRNTSNGTSAGTWVNWGNDAGAASGVIVMSSSTNTTKPSYFDIFNRTASGPLRLGTNNTARLTIDSAGAVTIPGSLGVTGILSLAGPLSITSANPGGWATGFRTVVDNNGGEARIYAYGADATTRGSFNFYSLEADGGNNGSVLSIAIGGVVTMPAYGAGAATFSAAGVISSVSDERLKIKDGVIADPIPMIMALEPGYYFGKPEANMGDGRQLGFYAQNVRKAIGPEAAPDPEDHVSLDADGNEISRTTRPWGYYDRSVLAVAIEALKVHEGRLAALQADFQSYKNSHP